MDWKGLKRKDSGSKNKFKVSMALWSTGHSTQSAREALSNKCLLMTLKRGQGVSRKCGDYGQIRVEEGSTGLVNNYTESTKLEKSGVNSRLF